MRGNLRSREKISVPEKRLPGIFLRIHRSFIVNTTKISGYSYEEVELQGTVPDIGRNYKKQVLESLKPGPARQGNEK